MSALLPTANTCCDPCTEPTTTAVPGPAGADGAAGASGTNGVNAFTTASSFVMPAELANVTVTVGNSTWMVADEILWVQGGGFEGFFQVQSKPDSTHAILKNLKDTGSSAYLVNSAPASVFPNGSAVTPAGVQGPGGSSPAGALLSANNLNDVASVPNSRANLGLGTAAVNATGDFFQVANNLNEGVAATKRTNLGLGTMATQDANAVAITGGTLNGSIGATTPAAGIFTSVQASGSVAFSNTVANSGKSFFQPSAIQSLLAATAINPNATVIRVVGNGGAVILTATPTITSPATDGQLILIRGTDDTNTVTLQDEASLAGTKLQLGAATRLLGKGDQILLAWDATDGFWYEVVFTNN